MFELCLSPGVAGCAEDAEAGRKSDKMIIREIKDLVEGYWRTRAEISLSKDRKYSLAQRERDKHAVQNRVFKDISLVLGIPWEAVPTHVPFKLEPMDQNGNPL